MVGDKCFGTDRAWGMQLVELVTDDQCPEAWVQALCHDRALQLLQMALRAEELANQVQPAQRCSPPNLRVYRVNMSWSSSPLLSSRLSREQQATRSTFKPAIRPPTPLFGSTVGGSGECGEAGSTLILCWQSARCECFKRRVGRGMCLPRLGVPITGPRGCVAAHVAVSADHNWC